MSGDAIEVQGTVALEARGDLYAVDAVIGAQTRRVWCRRSGKLVQRHIRVLPGDAVTCELSPYDVTRGRIIRRGPPRDSAATR